MRSILFLSLLLLLFSLQACTHFGGAPKTAGAQERSGCDEQPSDVSTAKPSEDE